MERINSKVEPKKSLIKKLFRWVLDSLLDMRRKSLLEMIAEDNDIMSPVLDMGCNQGYLTRPLSLKYNAIGLDIEKPVLRYAKNCNRQADYICCDLAHLPLKQYSISTAVCASVFEHLENLNETVKQLNFVLKNEGKLFAGYPIETRLLELVIKTFFSGSPEAVVWDQKNIMKHRDRLRNPHTHKQDYLAIRKTLQADFSILKIQKIPLTNLPDFLSIYENAKLVKRKN